MIIYLTIITPLIIVFVIFCVWTTLYLKHVYYHKLPVKIQASSSLFMKSFIIDLIKWTSNREALNDSNLTKNNIPINLYNNISNRNECNSELLSAENDLKTYSINLRRIEAIRSILKEIDIQNDSSEYEHIFQRIFQIKINEDNFNSFSTFEEISSLNYHEVIIVGGGPVGMTLASNLARRKISFLLLEKRDQRLYASRAIGVHPDTLEHFSALDQEIVDDWIENSVLVSKAQIISDEKLLGKAYLELARKPYNFSLAIDQNESEKIIEKGLYRILNQERLKELNNSILEFQSNFKSNIKNLYLKKVLSNFEILSIFFPCWISKFKKQMEVIKIEYILDADINILKKLGFMNIKDVKLSPYRYLVHYKNIQTNIVCYAVSKFVVGCEGKKSLVRETAQINYLGGPLRDTFIAGDFEDNSGLGYDAAIYLSRKGLVEAFPLPGNRRRFICSTDNPINKPTPEDIIKLVLERAQLDISKQECTWISNFGIQSLVADKYYNNGLVLAGDAAHICSPLGGQGMNCGFLDAFLLAKIFEDIQFQGIDESKLLQIYENKQKLIAKAAINRAELNTLLGRKSQSFSFYIIRNLFIKIALLNLFPIQWIIAMYFTMRFLGEIQFSELLVL